MPGRKTDLEYVQELKQGMLATYRRCVPASDEDAARQQAVQWALGRERVKSAGIAEDGNSLYVVLESGIRLVVLTE
jgi:hypothetical protein